MPSQFERNIKRAVEHRDWSEISGRWINFLPDIDPPGSSPDVSVSEFFPFEQAAENYFARNDHLPIEINIEGIREVVFREGIFLLHKSSHVIGNAEINAQRGVQTWSLSDAYQGALFGAKAVMHLLGVVLPSYQSRWVIIDLWPISTYRSRSKKRRRKLNLGVDENPVRIAAAGPRIEHRHIWRMFQRLLDTTTIEIWPEEYKGLLTQKLNHGLFSKQRNIIHYKNNGWIFDDLHEFSVNENFGKAINGLEEALKYSDDKSEFSMVLALLVLRMGYLLLDSIAENTNKLNSECELIRQKFNDNQHPLYLNLYRKK